MTMKFGHVENRDEGENIFLKTHVWEISCEN
jgi:hypothetical protein